MNPLFYSRSYVKDLKDKVISLEETIKAYEDIHEELREVVKPAPKQPLIDRIKEIIDNKP